MNSRDKLKRTRQIKRAVMEQMKLVDNGILKEGGSMGHYEAPASEPLDSMLSSNKPVSSYTRQELSQALKEVPEIEKKLQLGRGNLPPWTGQWIEDVKSRAAEMGLMSEKLNQMIREELGKLMEQGTDPDKDKDTEGSPPDTSSSEQRAAGFEAEAAKKRKQHRGPGMPMPGPAGTPPGHHAGAGLESAKNESQARLNQMIKEELQAALREGGCGDHSDHEGHSMGDIALTMPQESPESDIEGLAARAMAAIHDLASAAGVSLSTTVATGDDIEAEMPMMERTQLNEMDWLQRSMAYMTGQGDEFDTDARVAKQSAAADRLGYYGVPDPSYDPEGAHAVDVAAGLASDSPLDAENVEDSVQRSAGGLRGYSQEGERCRDGTIRDGDEICESQDPFERMKEIALKPYGTHKYKD